MKFVSIITIFVNLILSLKSVSPSYEYVCEDKELFKPYLHIYNGRNGPQINPLTGPGFHHIAQKENIYVCINGPAYLYYSNTSKLGRVYEAPQSKVFSHSCEMHNVKPHFNATKLRYQLHLMAVLLYGNEIDYRLPFLQPFTAPYYFEEDEYEIGFPAHYQNATSIVIIGQSICTLKKGDNILIRIEPIWPPVPIPLPPSVPPSPTLPLEIELDQYICRKGFSEIKEQAKITSPSKSNDTLMMKLLVNDEVITTPQCPPEKHTPTSFTARSLKLHARTLALHTKYWNKTLIDRQTEFKAKVNKTITEWIKERYAKLQLLPISNPCPPDAVGGVCPILTACPVAASCVLPPATLSCSTPEPCIVISPVSLISTCKPYCPTLIDCPDPTTSKCPCPATCQDFIPCATSGSKTTNLNLKQVKKLENKIKQLTELIDGETKCPNNKEQIFNDLLDETDKEVTSNPELKDKTGVIWPPALDGFNNTANKQLENYTDAFNNLTSFDNGQFLRNETSYLTNKTFTKEVEYSFMNDTKNLEDALSDWDLRISRAELMVERMEKESDYQITSRSRRVHKPSKVLPYKIRTLSETIKIDAAASPTACEKLPKRTGEEGECKKGKPDGVKACILLKASAGKLDSFNLTDGKTPTNDSWKREVLLLSGEIWMNACPYLPNRKKFIRQLIDIFSYYLTSNEVFNKPPPKEIGVSRACLAFREWERDNFVSSNKVADDPLVPDENANKFKRPSWDSIIENLRNCSKNKHKLEFINVSPYKKNFTDRWEWLDNNTNKTIKINRVEEQAEKEYVFNWVIDLIWRLFGTALGICMADYEKNNPLISTRFYALFTEDFLRPLRETWVNAKDNVIFQWILGEFYNGEAEKWTEICMEASFYSGNEDYRPIRSLFVNCHSEHNYYTSGRFNGTTGIYVLNP